ncbi:hypothetical protein [Pseudomonas sp. RIT-To-2]|uniref:hypothetical protein n=1 Tax=Pseudomonas sp. RIT-To-2 TaxID=3462541 RepID=UPI002413ACA0
MHDVFEKTFIATLVCTSDTLRGAVNVVPVGEIEGTGALGVREEGEGTALTFNYQGSPDGLPLFEITTGEPGAVLDIDINGALGLYPLDEEISNKWQLQVLEQGDEQVPARVQLKTEDGDAVLLDRSGGEGEETINVMDGEEVVFELRVVQWL